MQVTYATDLAFRFTTTLASLYDQLIRKSVLSVKAEQIASFLGRHIIPQLSREIGSQFSSGIEGPCVKNRFGKSSIKMYDKCGIVLRIETTTNDMSFFKHHRKVEHRDTRPTRELAPVNRSIYSLIDLREILFGCNRRYLPHLSAFDDFSAGVRALDRLTKPRKVEEKTARGATSSNRATNGLLNALQSPRVNPRDKCPGACIGGIRRVDLLPELEMLSPNRLSRQLRRLLDIGVIKRVTGTCRFYLPKAGRAAIAHGGRLTAVTIIQH